MQGYIYDACYTTQLDYDINYDADSKKLIMELNHKYGLKVFQKIEMLKSKGYGDNSAYYFRGEIISGVTGGGDTKGFFIEGVIKRGANAASTALVGTPTVTSNYADAGASAWAIAVTADTTNGGIRVTFTGQAATTIRTVCQIRTTEMTY